MRVSPRSKAQVLQSRATIYHLLALNAETQRGFVKLPGIEDTNARLAEIDGYGMTALDALNPTTGEIDQVKLGGALRQIVDQVEQAKDEIGLYNGGSNEVQAIAAESDAKLTGMIAKVDEAKAQVARANAVNTDIISGGVSEDVGTGTTELDAPEATETRPAAEG